MEKIYDLRDTHYYYNNDIKSSELKKIRLPSTSHNDKKENTTFHFEITDTNDPISLSESYLETKWKILKSNGDSINDDNVTAVCSMKGVKLQIGKQIIESVGDYHSYILQVKRLKDYTRDYSTSEATNIGFYPDTSDSADRNKTLLQDDGTITATTPITDVVNKLKIVKNENYNKGFKKRWELSKNSNTVTTWTPLKELFDFVAEYKKAISGFIIRLEFQRDDSRNMIYTDAANPDYKVEIEDIALWVRYVDFKNGAEILYNELKLSNTDIEINWNQYEINRSSPINKYKSGSDSISATSDEVLRLFVIPQYFDRNENPKKNNMIFDNLDMIECWLMINRSPLPAERYTMDFGKKEYNRLYESFLESGLNNLNTETGCMVNYSDFGKLYPVIHFDLSNHVNYTTLENLRIEFNWKLEKETTKEYVFYYILEVRKKCILNMNKKEITMIKTLGE